MIKLFIGVFLFSTLSWGQAAAPDYDPSQVKFNFLSSDGEMWLDCVTKKLDQPHSWTTSCGQYVFNLHMFSRDFTNSAETMVEFHYWATETAVLKETHTQSTWLTTDTANSTKKIVSYLGFSNDSMQLRVQIDLKK
ncbi:MAG: hypothetical protein H7256_02405 [Bdellovibrio sp.]|nr:hypothetical protein [Bdellovibrio sp.]